MTERLANANGDPDERLLSLYGRWATSGAALLLTGHVMVDRNAISEVGNVIMDGQSDLTALRAWADATQSYGAHGFVQINHPGRQAMRFVNKQQTVAPSAIALQGMAGAFGKPRALEAYEIDALIARYAETASVAKSAGFRGVQIHAAHGYLISQFLSPLTNLRTDRWGGDADARSRFLREVVRSVRAAVGRDFPIAVKLNSADFQRGGFDTEESMRVVELLESESVDLLEVSGGTYESAAMVKEINGSASTRAREAFFMEYAEQVRSRTRIQLMLTGGFRTASAMEEAVQSGVVDMVGLARPLILEPDLCKRLLTGQSTQAVSTNLSTGQKLVDGFVQNSWYSAQMHRMARGLDPDLSLARTCAAVSYFLPAKVSRAA